MREPTLADLEDAAAGDNHRKWNRTAQQQAKVRKDRKAMFSIPVFDRIPLGKRDLTNQLLLGVLSADTDASMIMMWLQGDALSAAGQKAVMIGKE